MPPLLRFIIVRLVSIPVTLLIVTMVLYGFVMLTSPEERATLYFGAGIDPERLGPQQIKRYTELIIERYHLREPYPVQYAYWAASLLRGDWGMSPNLHEDVLPALLRRTPVTAELTLYSLLLYIPLGLISGVMAGWKKDRFTDLSFRLAAFTATSFPVFVLAFVLLAIFYVGLGWFAPERLSALNALEVSRPGFPTITGLITLDGLLLGRVDLTLDALRHLILPVFTLSLLHWATLGRVTRAAMIEELSKDYITAGWARGLPQRSVVWRHALRNVLNPALTSSALSAATLFTGVYIVEVIYNFKGISEVGVVSVYGPPDAPAVLGFAIYSVIIILFIMLILDILQGLFDPRVREGIIHS